MTTQQIIGLVILIIGLLLMALTLTYLIYKLVKYIKLSNVVNTSLIKDEVKYIEKEPFKREIKKEILAILAFSISLLVFAIGCCVFSLFPLDAGNYSLVICYTLLLGIGIGVFACAFGHYFYQKGFKKEDKRIIKLILIVSIPVMIIGFVYALTGVGDYLTYPLYNGFSFGDKGIKLTTFADSSYYTGGNQWFHIAFYALCILSGAVLVYFICDHLFYKEYHKHGILETLFLIAFPAGIIGARLWYCLVLNWDKVISGQIQVYAIWDGGLAIMGGAIGGILAGVIYMRLARRYVPILKAVDFIVPTILIAQAIGRWGNFFNHEVYGNIVSQSSWWILPNWISSQMYVVGQADSIYVPLFLIEGIVNLCGYFIITRGVGRGLKKFIAPGDLGCSYLIWYGLVRVVMEPLRYHSSGSNVDYYMESWIAAFALIGAGILGVVACHLYDHFVTKRKVDNKEKTNG